MTTKSQRLRAENEREMSPVVRQLLVDCDRQLGASAAQVNEVTQFRHNQLRERIAEVIGAAGSNS